MATGMLWGVLCAQVLSGHGALAPHLSSAQIEALQRYTRVAPFRTNREVWEKDYQRLVQRQGFEDLAQIYHPANQHKLQISYATFVPESSPRPGDDRGYGFHVIKRLVIGDKVIEANEHWPEDRLTHGLLLPDEVRYKTRILDGPRRVEGSEKQYLFDSFRLAWGPSRDELEILRRTRFVYLPQERSNQRLNMRVPVSSPVSCVSCHQPLARFAQRFRAPGETINHEAIVQDSFYQQKIEEMDGYREYIDYLRGQGVAAERIAAIAEKLARPQETFALPELFLKLQTEMERFNWIESDRPIEGAEAKERIRQGRYQRRDGSWWVDATEDVIAGKYLWWNPQVVVP